MTFPVSIMSASDGSTKLTKGYSLTESGTIRKRPYPMVEFFTSTTIPVSTLIGLQAVVEGAAEAGNCLVKGILKRELVNESRRGMTTTGQTTEWLCLDYDADEGFDSPEELLSTIDPALDRVSFLFQHSASAGIGGRPIGVRGHYFILLTNPIPAPVIKQWLIKCNLNTAVFRNKLDLSSDNMSLRYALDVTTCQNDKLLYVAPPTLSGIPDPITGARTVMYTRAEHKYDLMPVVSAEKLQIAVGDAIEELQDMRGHVKRRPKHRYVSGVGDLITNPLRSHVSEHRAGELYTRLNINGGDSWAYWHYTGETDYVYSFKDGSVYVMKDFVPEYYEDLLERIKQGDDAPPIAEGEIKPIVFRDRVADVYYNCLCRGSTLITANIASSKDKLGDFMKQYGEKRPKVIVDWDVVFDTSTEVQVDHDKKWLNLFYPTDLMRMKGAASTSIPPTIERLLRHIAVDDETYEHLLNWLAVLFNTKDKTQTAWVFRGVPGTGKGLLFNQILLPYFGQYAFSSGTKGAKEDFNAHLNRNIVLWIDEAGFEVDGSYDDGYMDQLKYLITEHTIRLRAMRRNATNIRNFTNVIMATNKHVPIKLEAEDRRFNISPWQDVSLKKTPESWGRDNVAKLKEELPAFAVFMHNYKYDVERARTPLNNYAKEKLIELSSSSIDDFYKNLRTGNLEGLLANMPVDIPAPPRNTTYVVAKGHIDRWVQESREGKVSKLPTCDVADVYAFMFNKRDTTSEKIGKAMAFHGLDIRQMRTESGKRRGFMVRFDPVSDDELMHNEKESNVLEFKR